MKVDKRIERHSVSVLALYELLKAIASDSRSFLEKPGLHESLKSQGALAKLCIEDRGIIGSSLNTVKRIADQVINGGFPALDRLRLAALDVVTKTKATTVHSNKTTKVGLAKRVIELELSNQSLREDLLLYTLIVEKSLKQAHSYAMRADKPSVMALCHREQRELLDMIALRKTIP